MCESLELSKDYVCEISDHSLCEECDWCPCLEDVHSCDKFFEDAYRNGFGA